MMKSVVSVKRILGPGCTSRRKFVGRKSQADRLAAREARVAAYGAARRGVLARGRGQASVEVGPGPRGSRHLCWQSEQLCAGQENGRAPAQDRRRALKPARHTLSRQPLSHIFGDGAVHAPWSCACSALSSSTRAVLHHSQLCSSTLTAQYAQLGPVRPNLEGVQQGYRRSMPAKRPKTPHHAEVSEPRCLSSRLLQGFSRVPYVSKASSVSAVRF